MSYVQIRVWYDELISCSVPVAPIRAEKIYEQYSQFRAVINHVGLVHWEPGGGWKYDYISQMHTMLSDSKNAFLFPGVFKTMCAIDITYYPFDEQMCKLQFGAWSYHTHKMNLYNSSTTVNQDTYNKNGEWEIDHTKVTREEFAYECCPNEPFANVAFNIYLRRRHTFYVMNVILPSIMTSVLLLSVFFCTPGQKVQIGVVVLLSFRIFLLNVAADIPKTSDHIPLLGEFPTTFHLTLTPSHVHHEVPILYYRYLSDLHNGHHHNVHGADCLCAEPAPHHRPPGSRVGPTFHPHLHGPHAGHVLLIFKWPETESQH